MSGRSVLVLVLLGSLACKKVIGDKCTTSYDCSYSGDRVCDLAQYDGYCTVIGCDPGSCPDEAVCVNFNAHAPRLSRRYCMEGCEEDSDCRTPEYHCARPDPAACASSGSEELPEGQTCNRIVDTAPASPGWCVQVAQ